MLNLNRLTKTGVALLLATSIGAAGAYAQQPTAPGGAAGQPPASKRMVPPAPAAGPAARSDLGAKSPLIGMPVFSADGKKVGDVKTVTAAGTGKIVLIEVTSGGVLGIGAKTAKIPADKFNRQGKQVVVALPAAELNKLFK